MTLDYNGAVVTPTTDQDVLRIHPGGYAVEPRHDLRNIDGFTSASIHIDGSYGDGQFGSLRSTGTFGGWTSGTPGEGKGISVTDDTSTNGAVTFVRLMRHDIESVGTGVYIHASGDAAYCNSNYYSGTIHNVETGIHTLNDGNYADVKGNVFEACFQPNADNANIGWLVEGSEAVDQNTFYGFTWDAGNYADSLWKFNGGGIHNRLTTMNTNISHNNVTDNRDAPWGYFLQRDGYLDVPHYDSDSTAPKNTIYLNNNWVLKWKNPGGTVKTFSME